MAHLYDRQQYAKYWYDYFSNDHTPLIITYQIRSENGTLSDLVENNNKSFAGVIGEAIADVGIKINRGVIYYQVYPIGKKWYGVVSKFDWSDYNDGYAGIGKRIDKIRIYFLGTEQPYYRVASIGGEYSSWQYGNLVDEKRGFKGYAGEDNVPIEKIEIRACIPKNQIVNNYMTGDELKCIYPNNPDADDNTGFSKYLYFNSLLLLLLIINVI